MLASRRSWGGCDIRDPTFRSAADQIFVTMNKETSQTARAKTLKFSGHQTSEKAARRSYPQGNQTPKSANLIKKLTTPEPILNVTIRAKEFQN